MPWRPDHPTLFRRPPPRTAPPPCASSSRGPRATSGPHCCGPSPTSARVREIVGVARRRPEWHVPKVTWTAADVARDDLEPRRRAARTPSCTSPGSSSPAATSARRGRGERRGQPPRLRGGHRAGVPALVHASSVGAYAPGPKDRAVDESWPTHGDPDLVLLAPQGGRRARCSTTSRPRTRACARPAAPRARLPARGGLRDPAAVRRPAAALPLVRPRPHPGRAEHAAAALPGRARARPGRRVPPRAARRGARGAFNVAAEPVLDGPARPPRRRARRPRPRARPARPGGADLAGAAAARRRRAGSTSRSACRSWTPAARARRARLEPAPHGRRGAARAARRAAAVDGLPTPPLDPRDGRPAARARGPHRPGRERALSRRPGAGLASGFDRLYPCAP